MCLSETINRYFASNYIDEITGLGCFSSSAVDPILRIAEWKNITVCHSPQLKLLMTHNIVIKCRWAFFKNHWLVQKLQRQRNCLNCRYHGFKWYCIVFLLNTNKILLGFCLWTSVLLSLVNPLCTPSWIFLYSPWIYVYVYRIRPRFRFLSEINKFHVERHFRLRRSNVFLVFWNCFGCNDVLFITYVRHTEF